MNKLLLIPSAAVLLGLATPILAEDSPLTYTTVLETCYIFPNLDKKNVWVNEVKNAYDKATYEYEYKVKEKVKVLMPLADGKHLDQVFERIRLSKSRFNEDDVDSVMKKAQTFLSINHDNRCK